MHRMTGRLLTGFAWSIFSVFARAQQPTFKDALLDHLAGNWVLKGTIAGKETTHDVSAEWILEHQYLRIHEVSRETRPDRQPAYEADVFIGWNQGTNRYACVWLDDYGGIAPISFANAKRNGDAIPFVFRDQDSANLTTFSYNAQSDSWEWRIDTEEKGKVTPFARVKLTKRK
jgi:hypothetical protein